MTLTCIFILMSLLCFTSAQGHTGGVRSSLTYCDSKDSSSWLLATGQCTRCSGCAGAALQPGVPSAALAEQSRGGTTALRLQPQVTSSDPGCRQERFPSLFPPPPGSALVNASICKVSAPINKSWEFCQHSVIYSKQFQCYGEVHCSCLPPSVANISLPCAFQDYH